jgi:FMN phosphatase YigB (HAD superfamily)
MHRKLLICDLDNTLYDWTAYFVPAFYAMVDEVVSITRCDRERLLDDFRAVHQRHHDSEHPFSLLETATIQELFSGYSPPEVAEKLDAAFHAFNAVRKRALRLYPGVKETLEALRDGDVRLVAHTESTFYAAVDRLTRLELTEYFHHIYCRERSPTLHPDPDGAASRLSAFPFQRIVEFSGHRRKPDPEIVLEICRRNAMPTGASIYVGDSVARDILMAKRAGVTAVWARYGATHSESEYQKLVRITHWTPEDVAREADLKAQAADVTPDYVLESEFSEILNALQPGVDSGLAPTAR